MSIYYPQGIIQLRAVLEDFGYNSNPRLQKPYVWTVVARRLSVSLNNYREADTFTAEIDYKNFPLDPRVIRSLGVSIYLENKGQIFDAGRSNGLDRIKPGYDNIIFQGFADTDKIVLNENNRTISLDGRDFTSLLIDREYLGDPIVTSKPLDQVIQDLLNQLTETKTDASEPGTGLLLDNQTGETLPILADVEGSKDALAGLYNSKGKKSYWDIIQELISNTGLICYVSLDRLVITKPRNLYDRRKSKVFVFGRNVKELEYERKLGRQKGFNVRCIALDFEGKELITANIPEEATEAWAKDIGVKREPIRLPVAKAPQAVPSNDPKNPTNTGTTTPQPQGAQGSTEKDVAPYLTFRITKIKDKDHLVTIGEKIFEEVGRQQIEGKLSTREMKVFSPEVKGEDQFFNATKFRIGTPIEIRIDQGDLEGIPSNLRPAARSSKDVDTPQQRDERRKTIAARLRQRGYERQIADALAESLTLFDTPFYVKDVEFTLDQEDGFSMSLGFINFIEIPQNLVEGNV
jgi:hypothetical protein